MSSFLLCYFNFQNGKNRGQVFFGNCSTGSCWLRPMQSWYFQQALDAGWFFQRSRDGTCGCMRHVLLRCDFDTVGTAKILSREAAYRTYQNSPAIFCGFSLWRVFTQVDPGILTDFTSPSTSSFHRQSQISPFSTRTLGSVCDLSGSLFLNENNWHWHVEMRRIDMIETHQHFNTFENSWAVSVVPILYYFATRGSQANESFPDVAPTVI